MGAGASAAAALDLPERLDEAACREAAGELFNEATFAALAKDDAGTVLREDALAAFDDGLGEVVDPNAPVAEPEPEPEPEVPKTAEELSDEEFEEEMAALGRQTVKLRVHMYSRNPERGGLGGEAASGVQTRTASATATLLPPSAAPTGTSHRLVPTPLSFEIRAGPRATFKWLALVATQRYLNETSQTGEGRQREGVGSAPKGTSLLPAYVSTEEDNDSFHDPDALLFEGDAPLTDGQQVWVTLDDAAALEGDTVAPAATRWSTAAFAKRRPKQQEAARATEAELAVERSARRAEKAAQAHKARIAHKIDSMRRVLGDVAAHNEMEAKLRQHHLTLAGDTLSLLDDEESVNATVDVLSTNFTSLKELFRTYATGTKGKVTVMTSGDFSKFALDCKALQPEKTWKLGDLYNDSCVKEEGLKNRSGKSKSSTDKLMVSPDTPIVTTAMDMAGFLTAQRNLAFTRFLEEENGKMTPEQIKDLGRHKIRSPADATQVLLNLCVLQLLDKNALMSLVKEALGVDEVLCTYFDSLAPLRGVFEKYSMSDGVVETMTLVEFSALIRDSGLMSMTEAKKVFALVQQHSSSDDASAVGHPDHAATNRGGQPPLPPQQQQPPAAAVHDDDSLMTFAEFLGGIAKIGMWKFHGAGGSLAVKINKAVETVCALWTEADEEADGGDNGDGGGFGADVAASVSDVTQSRIL